MNAASVVGFNSNTRPQNPGVNFLLMPRVTSLPSGTGGGVLFERSNEPWLAVSVGVIGETSMSTRDQ